MSWVHLSTTSRNAAANVIADLVDAGAAEGTIEIYDDSAAPPASANDAVPAGAVLLVTLTFSDPAFGDAVEGVAPGGTITAAAAVDDGTASWARVKDSNGNVIFDCSVGETSATLILNSTSIVTSANVSISSASITMPSGE